MKTAKRKINAAFVMPSRFFDLIYGKEERDAAGRLFDIPPFTIDPDELPGHSSILGEAEVIFSGWGAPVLNDDFLDLVPRLKIFLYAGGGTKGIVTDAFWRRDIALCGGWGANAVPVAEFTLAQIILSLKRTWHFIHQVREQRSHAFSRAVPGAFGSTIGLISLGMIGRQVREKLRILDVNVLAYDPYISPQEANELDVELCSLENLFSRSDVVSLHSPLLKETREMIGGRYLQVMRPGSTLINTARGALINESEMIEVLRVRPDLYAVLDVTCTEPPVPDSPLYTLPNVVLTPHISGSMEAECRRMGQYMVEEGQRFIRGNALRWQVTQAKHAILA